MSAQELEEDEGVWDDDAPEEGGAEPAVDCFPEQPLTAQQQAEVEQLLHESDHEAYGHFKSGFVNAEQGLVKLRDYQLEALQLLIRHFRLTPQRMPGIQWTMGLGKSVLIAAAACLARTLTFSQKQQQQQQQQQDPPKVLVLVPSTAIRRQLVEALRRDAPPGKFGGLQPHQAVLELGPELWPADGRIKSFADDATGRCHIVVACYQKMHGMLSAVMQGQGADPGLFSLIITDEAHHSRARSYEGVFQHFCAAQRLFLTANMMRHDRLRVDCDIISIRSFVWAAQHSHIKKPVLTVYS